MIKYPYTILLLFTFILSSQSFALTIKAAAPQFHSKTIAPPGTVSISDNFYFDKTETSNINWQEYVYWNKNKFGENSTEYLAALPDTTIWSETEAPFKAHYFKHPSYNNFPVVGISYEQAVKYCAWRSDRVNEMIFARAHKEAYEKYKADNNSVNIPEIFQYRLPTKEEWEKIALSPYSKKVMRKQKGAPSYNFQGELNDRDLPLDAVSITTSVDGYWPNIYGVYNIMGNVAEMVQEKGTAKGGSWFHTEEDSQPNQNQYYTSSKSWLGFRCVCEKNS